MAKVELGAEEAEMVAKHGKKGAVYLGVWPLIGENEIDVAHRLRDEMTRIRGTLPPDVDMQMAYDGTVFMEDALEEITKTLTETILIVGAVVFLFLGSIRTALVPLIAMPISLVGAAIVMYLAGFSLNLLTILAIVLVVVRKRLRRQENLRPTLTFAPSSHTPIPPGRSRQRCSLPDALRIPRFLVTSSQPLPAPRPFPTALALGLLLAFAASCGGESTPAPESAHGAARETASAKASDDDSASDGAASEEESESAPRAACDDGTCFVCGAGSCPQGWYCDESASGGAACSWLPECSKKSDCACISKALGSACSCTDEGGGPHAKCK